MEEEFNINSNAPANVDSAEGKTDSQMGITSDSISDYINSIVGIKDLNMPPVLQSEILEPQYFEPTRNKSVIVGNVEGLNLMSAGVPMFSASVLQKANEELKKAKELKYKNDLKDAENLIKQITPIHINDNIKNNGFAEFQIKEYKGLLSDLYDKYGSNFYKLGKTEIINKTHKINVLKNALDETTAKVKKVLMNNELDLKKKSYISKKVYNMAKQFADDVMSDDFKNLSIDEIYKKVGNVSKEIIMVENMETAINPLLENVENFTRYGDWERVFGYGNNEIYEKVKYKGWSAIKQDKELETRFNNYIDLYYDMAYGNYEEQYKPKIEDFRELAYSKLTDEIIETQQTLKGTSSSTTRDNNGNKIINNNKTDMPLTIANILFTVKNSYTLSSPKNIKNLSANTVAIETYSGKRLSTENLEDIIIQSVFNFNGYSYVLAMAKTEREVELGKTGKVNIQTVFPLTSQISDAVGIEDNNFTTPYNIITTEKELENAKKELDRMLVSSAKIKFGGDNKPIEDNNGSSTESTNKSLSGIPW